MKRWLALASLAAFTAAAICTLLSGWQTRCLLVPLKAFAASSPAAVVSIDELMKNADHYPGLVRVEGVVSTVFREQQTIILVDPQESDCGVTDFAALPVRWAGPLPGLRDIVRVEGRMQQLAGELIFAAQSLEKVVPEAEGVK